MMTKQQQITASVIAYEGAFAFQDWIEREHVAEAFAEAFSRKSRSFNRSAFIEACKRESEKVES